jgi:hypothetical protein
MLEIKQAYQAGKISVLQAAGLLTRWNGNPIGGNVDIVRRWKRG